MSLVQRHKRNMSGDLKPVDGGNQIVEPLLPAAIYKVGQEVRLTKNVYDGGEDHHPPGYLAYAGETLVVRKVTNGTLISVSHEGIIDRSFKLYDGEFEAI